MGEYKAEGAAVHGLDGKLLVVCWTGVGAEFVADELNQLLRDVRVLQAFVRAQEKLKSLRILNLQEPDKHRMEIKEATDAFEEAETTLNNSGALTRWGER